MSDIDADPTVLQAITSTLRRASDDIENLAGSIPSAPDAGLATAALTAILSDLVKGAGTLSTSASTIAEAVASSNTTYLENEQNAADSFHQGGR